MTELNKDEIYRLCIITSFLLRWVQDTRIEEIDEDWYYRDRLYPNPDSWSFIVNFSNFYIKRIGLPEIIDAYTVAETLFPREYDYLDQLRQVMREAA
jgi:hypothetical protein